MTTYLKELNPKRGWCN